MFLRYNRLCSLIKSINQSVHVSSSLEENTNDRVGNEGAMEGFLSIFFSAFNYSKCGFWWECAVPFFAFEDAFLLHVTKFRHQPAWVVGTRVSVKAVPPYASQTPATHEMIIYNPSFSIRCLLFHSFALSLRRDLFDPVLGVWNIVAGYEIRVLPSSTSWPECEAPETFLNSSHVIMESSKL